LKFKTIILFSPRNEKTLAFKAKLEGIKYIKLFQTTVVDEVQQVIDMSDQSVILADDEVEANKIFKGTLNKKRARFKKFYLNWFLTLPKMSRDTFLDQEYTLINSEEIDTVVERVELYFFGKVNIFSKRDAPPEVEVDKKSFFRKGYFTHLEKGRNEWKILVSSHEADDEISEMLGKNWDRYLENLLYSASDRMPMQETRLDSADYQEIVFPHFAEGKLQKISVVHVAVDEDFAKNIISVHSFLKTL
jgi:hypothetical protein